MSRKFLVSERWLRSVSHALWALEVDNIHLTTSQEIALHQIIDGIKVMLENPAKYELMSVLDDVKKHMNQNNTGNEG